MKTVYELSDVKYLNARMAVRYWEDTEVNGKEDTESGDNIPCKDGDIWELDIDIDTGEITNWPSGITANVHYKICDCGWYTLQDKDRNEIYWYEGYVPKCLGVGEKNEGYGFGDYAIFKINENGVIEGWDKSLISGFNDGFRED